MEKEKLKLEWRFEEIDLDEMVSEFEEANEIDAFSCGGRAYCGGGSIGG